MMTNDQASTTISRRHVAQGAAWSVPVIAVGAAAPNAAASPCQELKTVVWSNYTGTYPTVVTVAGTTTMAITSTLPRGNVSGPVNNLRVANGPDGGFPSTQDYLEIALPATNNNQLFTQTVTFTFSAPVTNLTVTLGDIDSAGSLNVFQEAVYLSPGGFTTNFVGSTLTGTGTLADPWLATDGVSVPGTSGSGNVIVTYPGPITSFSVTMFDPYDPAGSSSGHSIDVFDMTFVGC